MRLPRLALITAVLPFALLRSSAADAPPFIFKWGEPGPEPGRINAPVAIAADPFGGVLVCEQTRVQKFTAYGGFLAELDASASRPFQGVSGVATDPGGNVYIVDSIDDRIKKFDVFGNLVSMWGGSGCEDERFGLPTAIAIDPGGFVYTYDYVCNSIRKFSFAGAFVHRWTPEHQVVALAFAPGGYLLASEEWSAFGEFNSRVAVYSSAGAYIRSFGEGGPSPIPNGAAGLGCDAAGNVYSSHPGSQTLRMFDAQGNLLAEWGTYGSGDGEFNGPVDVDVDGPGRIYVADRNNNRVQMFGTDLVNVRPAENASLFRLGPVGPNPFITSSVEIRFSTPHPAPVSVVIYDVLGSRLRRWRWDRLPAGPHAVHWDGLSDHGRPVPAGVLFVQLVMRDRVATRRIVRL